MACDNRIDKQEGLEAEKKKSTEVKNSQTFTKKMNM